MTANVRDFGARLALFDALLSNGIHVVVLRPGPKRVLTPEVQVSILALHSLRIVRELQAATEPTLIRVTQTEVRARTLRELREEILGA